MVLSAEGPSGSGADAETCILAHRKKGKGFEMSAQWVDYVDLGDKRDMAVFKLTTKQGQNQTDYQLGSVHLTPDDPDRGEQMIKVADWLVAQGSKPSIVMGDFNWGYKKKSGVENYRGENKVTELHEQEELFQLFHSLSYLGKGSTGDLRTNKGFRKGAYFYDQFLMTPALANQLADAFCNSPSRFLRSWRWVLRPSLRW